MASEGRGGSKNHHHDSLSLKLLFDFNNSLNGFNSAKLFYKWIRKFRVMNKRRIKRTSEKNIKYFTFKRYLFNYERLMKEMVYKLFHFFFLFEKIHFLNLLNHDKVMDIFKGRINLIEKEFNYFRKMLERKFHDEMDLYRMKNRIFFPTFSSESASKIFLFKIDNFYEKKSTNYDAFGTTHVKKKKHQLEYDHSLMSVSLDDKLNRLKNLKKKLEADQQIRMKSDYKRYQILRRVNFGLEKKMVNQRIVLKRREEQMKIFQSKWKQNVLNHRNRNRKLRECNEKLRVLLKGKKLKIEQLQSDAKFEYMKKLNDQKMLGRNLRSKLKMAHNVIKKFKLNRKYESVCEKRANFFKIEKKQLCSLQEVFKRKNCVLIEIAKLRSIMNRLQNENENLTSKRDKYLRRTRVCKEIFRRRNNPLLIITKLAV